MNRRAKAKLVAMLIASPLVVAPPAWVLVAAPPASASLRPSARASGGGASPLAPLSATSLGPAASGSGGASPGTAGSQTVAQSGSTVATASGDGITVTTNVSAMFGRALAFTGTTSSRRAGATIDVQRLDPQAGWVSVASGAVARGGTFSVPWHTNYVGRVTMRTVIERTASASQTRPTSPSLQVTVYRPGRATFYGEGFYGEKTACGQILTRAMLGVASRTLKCGTPVQIYYRGRTIVVPVIDRGPYANHASWDLTQATAQALGILGTETVGAMPV